jgi:hypothetical protein
VWELEADPIRVARDSVTRTPWCADVNLLGSRLRVLSQPDIRQDVVADYLQGQGVVVASLRSVQPSLEDVFMRMRRGGATEGSDAT